MNISKKLKGLLAAYVAAVGLTAFAVPTVTVGEVKTDEPWSTITVDYMLGGTDATLNYNVVFDVTADGRTASVTNAAARVTNGWATQKIDTAALFGKQVVDTQAKVKVTLIAIKPKMPGVQLWAYGPYWAESNLGDSNVDGHPWYGARYTYSSATREVAKLGDGWRLPSSDEFRSLLSKCSMEWTSRGGDNGFLFTGKTDGYTDKSIFLPAAGSSGGANAGEQGWYWSSTCYGSYSDRLYFRANGGTEVGNSHTSCDFSVRVVRDAK